MVISEVLLEEEGQAVDKCSPAARCTVSGCKKEQGCF